MPQTKNSVSVLLRVHNGYCPDQIILVLLQLLCGLLAADTDGPACHGSGLFFYRFPVHRVRLSNLTNLPVVLQRHGISLPP